jgi:hypothetical protein
VLQSSLRLKLSLDSGQRINEGQSAGKQLHRWIGRFLVAHFRIEGIAKDWESDGSHMDAELVLLARGRLQAEESKTIPRFEQLDLRTRVDRSFFQDLPAKPRCACAQPVFDPPELLLRDLDQACDRKVFPLDFLLCEEFVIAGP